jgi:PAS domain S-box-containing protein
MTTTRQRTVLLIDDSAEDRATYCRYLNQDIHGSYNIIEAELAAIGLEICKKSLPDVLLLDYLLPDMDGLEFLKLLVEQVGKQCLPVLMLTGQGDETIATQAMKNGAQDYLVKSNLTADGLCKTVAHTIEQFQLQQQLAQQRQQQQIIAATALRIRQSITLQTILDTSAAQVRQFLQADRVVVYQFTPNMDGEIVTEAVLPGWKKSLHVQISDTCFQQNKGGNYQLGETRAIDDIYKANLAPCHLRLLEKFQVKANLVVPILIEHPRCETLEVEPTELCPHLWGLLVIHQCSAPRQWQPFEIDLLSQLAVQMAIAIQQATAYQQLQRELAERERIEAVLRESEQRYLSLSAATPVGIFWVDLEGNYRYVNDRWCQIAGVSSEAAMGTGWSSTLHPGDRDNIALEWVLSIKEKRPFQLEYRFQRPDGSITWVFGQAIAEEDRNGEIQGYIGTVTDISDRKAAETALQQLNHELETRVQQRTVKLQTSETNLREAQRIAHLGSWEFDLATQKITCSEELLRIYGLNPDQSELTSTEHLQCFHPNDCDRFNTVMQQAMKTGIFEATELQFSRPNGSVGWVLTQAEALRNPLGEVVKLFGTSLDISDRKLAEIERQQVEDSLRASEERWQLALQGNNDGIWDWNIQTNEIFYSVRWKEMLGYADHEIPHHFEEWSSRVHPQDFERVMSLHTAHIQQKLPYQAEYRMRCKDGSYKWILDRGQALWDGTGVPIRMVGSHTDISDRKQAEQALQQANEQLELRVQQRTAELSQINQQLRLEIAERQQTELALRESEQRFRATFNQAAVGIAHVGLDGNWLRVNQKLCEIVGYTDAELVTRTFQDITDPEDLETDLQYVRKLLANEIQSYSMEKRYIHKNGSRIWINLTGSLVRKPNLENPAEPGEPSYFISVIEDIRDRKQAQQALQEARQSLEVQVQERTKELTAANMALKTKIAERLETDRQLAALTTELQRSNRDLEQFAYVASHDLQEPLRAITSYTQLLAKRYQGQLDDKAEKYIYYVVDGATRMQRLIQDLLAYSRVGKNKLKRQPTDCNVVLAQVIKDLGVAIAESQATISVDPMPTILADPAQVAQVWQNLISNAIKYRGKTAPIIQASVTQQQATWVFSVQDNGIGIESQYAERIFAIFQRLHTRREYEGTGLGLAICKRIIEFHDGQIWVESQLGQGATFFFTFSSLPHL